MPPAFDFPGSPSLGDVFTDPSGASYNWNGYAWMGGAANSLGALVVSDTPPAAPANNSLWFESDTGMLFLRYNDGNSSQWVQVNALPNGAGYMPLQGVSDGSNALPGQIGEVISSVVTTPVSLIAAGNAVNVASIVLTPGDWDVCGETWLSMAGSTTVTQIGSVINTVSATVPPLGLGTARVMLNVAAASGLQIFALKPIRASLTTSTTYYLIGHSVFASGTATATGLIWARRAR